MNAGSTEFDSEAGQWQPLVSVILPTHNRASLLGRAVHSVLTQTYRNLELLVVDDCSTDETGAVMQQFTDARLRYIRLTQNRRAAAARNIGIAEARGELIAFQDDDDVWLVDKLARQVRALLAEGPDVGLNLCGKIRLYPDCAEYIGGSAAFARLEFRRGGPLDGFGLISTPSWLVRKQVLLGAGLFDEDMKSWDDWELALRLSGRCRFSHLSEPLYIQDRAQGGGMWKNESVYSNDMRIILRKHPDLWKTHRAVLSRNYYLLGRSEVMFHSPVQGRRWLMRAIAQNVLNIRAWVALVLSLGGAAFVRRLVETSRRLRRNSPTFVRGL